MYEKSFYLFQPPLQWIHNKDQKQATRYVCQFSLKKKGGFDCKASYRTKKFKHDVSVTVEIAHDVTWTVLIWYFDLNCVSLDFTPKKFESLPTLFLISHLFCFCSLIANSYLDLNLAKKKYYDTLNLIITSHPHHYFGSLLPISLWSFAATSLILFKITLYFILLSFLFTF